MVLFGLLFPLPKSFALQEPLQKLNDGIENISSINKLSLSLHASANDIYIQVTEKSQI
jgi:hypothetical protein